jgi:hypothetical protein
MRSKPYNRGEQAPLTEVAPRRPFVDLRKLGDDFRAQELEADLRAGNVTPIAGNAGQKPVRDAPRLASQYGGTPADWVKVTTKSRTLSNGRVVSMHAYRNRQTLEIVEEKFIIDEWTKIPQQ